MTAPASFVEMSQQFSVVAPPMSWPLSLMTARMGAWQTTLRDVVKMSGKGLHSNETVSLTLRPAPANHGIVFVRADIDNQEEASIPALCANVCKTTLASTIGNGFGHSVGTVEHLMAALAFLRVDNALIEVTASEVPIMDGSAKPFVEAMSRVGTRELAAARRVFRIKKTIRVESDEDGYCELVPDDEQIFEAVIDFESSAIGRQSYEMKLDDSQFDEAVIQARTFGMLQDVEALQKAGLALGGSLESAIVIDDNKVLNEEGLRSDDEFVQHKILDAIGDLYLAGLPIIGRYRGYKSGHALHKALLTKLFDDPDSFELVGLPVDEAVRTAAE